MNREPNPTPGKRGEAVWYPPATDQPELKLNPPETLNLEAMTPNP